MDGRSGRQPAGSRAVVQRRDMTLDVDIPPGPLSGAYYQLQCWLPGEYRWYGRLGLLAHWC